jgi:DNA (cytosine-5)-methyltransferase 1
VDVIYGSICSGIEAATVAWERLGWKAAFYSEIDPFCCALLTHYYPGVPNLGDMTKIDGAEWRDKIDVLVGGTPCQAFSVAGHRASLDDERGNLTLRFVELAHAIDPRYVVWENVPGVLSTRDNAFGCFLGGLVGSDAALEPCPFSEQSRYWVVNRKPYRWRWNYMLNGWDVTGVRESRRVRWPDAGMVAGPQRTAAWRILDAQYFRLAQRRRRVFVVSCRTGDGINPGSILFEPDSVRRNHAPSRETGQSATGTLAARTRGGGGLGTDFDLRGGIQPWQR